MLRLLANFVIAFLWMTLFQAFGWIDLTKTINETNPFLNWLAITAAISGIFTIALLVASFVFKMLVGLTCGLGCVAFPIYFGALGYIGFDVISRVLPEWILVTDNMWIVALMGILIAVFRIPEVKLKLSLKVNTSQGYSE